MMKAEKVQKAGQEGVILMSWDVVYLELYLVFVPKSCHKAPKIPGMSGVMGVSLIFNGSPFCAHLGLC